ncbi:MAG: hypothetical protein AAF192_04365 [Pseudomonadota bacterium]
MSAALQGDNWGASARIGLFIVGAEAVPEAEWWAMAPPGVSVHAARVTAPSPWVAWDGARARLSPDLARGAAQFAGMGLSAAVLAHSTSSLVGGEGWDAAAAGALAEAMGPGPAVTTNGQDCLAALRAVNATKPFVVLPPWFGDGAFAQAEAYLARHGASPAALFRHVPEARWRDVPPNRLYAERMHMAQRADLLLDQILARCPAEADGVLIFGTGFRCVALIEAAEAASGRPVVTANQASLWRALALSGVAARPGGYGALFAQAAPV